MRIQDGSGGGNVSRGWHILRSQWKDFVQKRAQTDCFLNQSASDGVASMAVQRPGFPHLSKDAFDRMYDKIMSHYASESPRTLAKAKVWQNAYQSNNELRAVLGDPWLHQRGDASWERTALPPPVDPAMDFFPRDWSNCLSEDTLAELIVDAYSSDFCDALIDGAISLVEVSNKWNAAQSSQAASSSQTLVHSHSDGSLQKPRVNQRLRNASPSNKALLEMGLVEQEAMGMEGFTMGGMTKDTWDAWNQRNYHKCKPLDPFVKRIEKATEAQRPQRSLAERQRLKQPPDQSPKVVDQRKFAYPMVATNFPKSWEKASIRPPERHPERRDEEDDNAPPKWMIKVGKDGKTRFPYSLVSHRAFLDGQKDPKLKEKAKRLAPLRISSDVS